MRELEFHRLTLEEYDLVQSYMSVHGNGSCQHSFVTMYSLYEKYGDHICEQDGFLYVLRSHMCDDDYRVYLAPIGDGDLKAAFETILADAGRYQKKARFFTLTEEMKVFLEQEFPGRFLYSLERDLAEYIYTTESMSTFAGGKLAKRRKEINHFWRLYGETAVVTPITPDDFDDILKYEEIWLTENSETHDKASLEREARTIRLQLEHFDRLHLSGIVLRIDGVIKGYGYGTRLSGQYYDALIEKGDKQTPHVYKVLRQESVKQCAMECTYVNLEEDLGIEGLRNLKYAYNPAFLIEKYIVTERKE